MAMKLSTGKVAFPIEFDNGDKDCIYFNPNDPDLAVRMVAAKDKITNRINEMEADDIYVDSAGEIADVENIIDVFELTEEQEKSLSEKAEKTVAILENTKKVVCEELDTAFGSEVSKVVFKHCSPFAVVDGEYFIMHFLNAITPEIQKYINKGNAEVEKKMSKHLAKYMNK